MTLTLLALASLADSDFREAMYFLHSLADWTLQRLANDTADPQRFKQSARDNGRLFRSRPS